ncbi:nitroreductase family protein [Bacteroides sp.]|uniref:nitroreductase family protein n=1 Tax=Bacteroides sp. TaxID=29523 RepID=UPI0026324B92|nr:nitroreductase family protein [Bacteroides sp.]
MDIDVYAITKQGTYKYDPDKHELIWLAEGDYRRAAGGGQDFVASVPVVLILAADYTKYDTVYNPTGFDLSQYVLFTAAMDAGIVSQNINLFCAGNGLATISHSMMDHKVLSEVLKLNESQYLLLNNAVGYPAE